MLLTRKDCPSKPQGTRGTTDFAPTTHDFVPTTHEYYLLPLGLGLILQCDYWNREQLES